MLDTLIPVEEYLSTAYRPDVDYVDGRIEERNVGEKDHSKLRFRIAQMLDRTNVLVPFMETRLKVSANRYRVPDICAYEKEPGEQIFTQAPNLCVEILSPEDRLSRTIMRTEDFLAMGVPTVWVLDPLNQKAYVTGRTQGFREVTAEIATQDRRVVLDLEEVFSQEKLG